ncbi:hypothetical protein OG792_20460 [Micromonospora sp. NBC_01699]|uniref:hypothetical protein n=1 Tax=Micromonospora sp. NBC_01699 TaxID=2975984 RepID=UPI002E2CB519|nr:hypothetical protein [Micromonospora sp. NBC_01699]
MLLKRLTQAAIAMLTLVTAAVVGVSPAQAASPFSATYTHSGGAVAVVVRGDYSWSNRSVSFANVEIYVRVDECAKARFEGWNVQTGSLLDADEWEVCNYNSTAQYFPIAPPGLNGSCCYGGVGRFIVKAIDVTHGGGTGSSTYLR